MELTQTQISEIVGMIKATPDPNDTRAKPADTVPTLRRRKAEVETKAHAFIEQMTALDREMTPEETRQLDVFTNMQLQAAKLLEAAEKWSVVDTAVVDNGDGRSKVRKNDLMPHNDLRNTRNNRYSYSLMKAMRQWADRAKLDGIEGEVQAEMDKIPRAPGSRRSMFGPGISVPLDLPIDLEKAMRYAQRGGMSKGTIASMVKTRRALARELGEERALDTTAGAGSIPTILDTTLIEILRARMVTYNSGARVMTDMQGLFAIPRQATASTFYMVGQGGPITASNQTIDQVPFSPHTGGVNTQYTRQFLEQTNQDAEMFVREDQAAVVARGVETAAFNGQASAGYPLGLLQNMQIGVYPLGTNGLAPTWTQIVSQEAYVAYYNADVGSLGYVTDALIRGTLKLTTKVASSTFPIYLWNTEAPDFPVNGYPCMITNLLPQNLTKGSGTSLHAMIFGNWEDLIYAFWSGMDVIVDPYTSASQGAVNIITLQDFDVNVRHYQSFANCVDIISSITAPVT